MYESLLCNVNLLCPLRSIAAHRDHFVRRLSVHACVCLSGSHTFLVVTHSYVSQATRAFLGMLPLCFVFSTWLLTSSASECKYKQHHIHFSTCTLWYNATWVQLNAQYYKINTYLIQVGNELQPSSFKFVSIRTFETLPDLCTMMLWSF